MAYRVSAGSAGPQDKQHHISRGIIAARVLAISSMMYVHAWTGDPLHRTAENLDAFGWAATFLIDVLGRSSVPLLTIISGYLIASQMLGGREWKTLVRDRFRTLLLPLWLWNAIYLFLLFVGVSAGFWRVPDAIHEAHWTSTTLALAGPPAQTPLAFLRDLFVCALISPVLVAGVRMAPAATLFAIAILVVSDWKQPVILRPQILLFYTIGLLFGLRIAVPLGLTVCRWLPLALGMVVLWFVISHWPEVGQYFAGPAREALSNFSRLGIAWLFWGICLFISNTPAYTLLKCIEPYIFLSFCSHFILFKAIGKLGNPSSEWVPIIFFVQPYLAILCAMVFAFVLQPVLPGLLRVLNAGRLPRPLDAAPKAGPQQNGN